MLVAALLAVGTAVQGVMVAWRSAAGAEALKVSDEGSGQLPLQQDQRLVVFEKTMSGSCWSVHCWGQLGSV